uniref:Uncharacterized protein n=1 Tax=Rhodnius prolixus TaxID=13249 RepID=T1I8D6_RHOPR
MGTRDAERSGRPVEVTTPEIIDKIHDMVMDDRRVLWASRMNGYEMKVRWNVLRYGLITACLVLVVTVYALGGNRPPTDHPKGRPLRNLKARSPPDPKKPKPVTINATEPSEAVWAERRRHVLQSNVSPLMLYLHFWRSYGLKPDRGFIRTTGFDNDYENYIKNCEK